VKIAKVRNASICVWCICKRKILEETGYGDSSIFDVRFIKKNVGHIYFNEHEFSQWNTRISEQYTQGRFCIGN